MNNEAEAIQQFVVWLLQTLDSANSTESSTPSGDWNQATLPEQFESGMQFSAEPLSSAEAAGTLSQDQNDQNQDQSVANPPDMSMALDEELPPLTFGDIPAVQNRFHALLKQRLKTEIERNPPRFPWETEQQDYQDDYQSDYQYGYEGCPEPSYSEAQLPFRRTARQPVNLSVNLPVNPSAPLWAAHLKTISLPIPLPDSVLHTLFEQCRHLMLSSLREGRRLVEAAESLFPGEKAALEGIAGLVLTSPVRSGHDSSLRSHPNIPIDYEQASRPQQMVLSLLAARQLFEAMTLPLSSDGSAVNRSWLTEVGHLTLEGWYSPDSGRAKIKVQLPVGGTVRFQQNISEQNISEQNISEQNISEQNISEQNISEQTTLESIASCTQAGELSVSLSPLNPERAVTLTIELAGSDIPLVFAVRLPAE